MPLGQVGVPAVALEVAEVVDPEPGEGQFLLEVVRTGICGSAPALVRGHAAGQGFPCRRAGGCRNAGEAGIPAPLGGWRDPSNTRADLREAFAKIKALLRAEAARSREALDAAIAVAMRAVTPDDAAGWFAHAGYTAPIN